MSDKKAECRGCIGFDEAHTCDGWKMFQVMKKEKDRCRACEAKDAEIERLMERLEMWPVDPETGKFLKDHDVLSDSCDGIECRNETIRQQDELLEKYRKENAKLQAVVDATTVGMARFDRDNYPFPREIREALAALNTGEEDDG